jgi:hypothetical protein
LRVIHTRQSVVRSVGGEARGGQGRICPGNDRVEVSQDNGSCRFILVVFSERDGGALADFGCGLWGFAIGAVGQKELPVLRYSKL